ncbi:MULTISPECIES: hypothetical protein [Actinomadura]|uniref:Uncharacterized protein n=1 Tax=Actinomadura yumaensis TaxID=111807 RepID=A0ABW2CTZ5_9ACTN|nr:hypothetical protein [Actinomadura sp. J1-007]MWK39555.1 hypothetical protein [Actinomadura sp. J1-007]
MGAQPTRAVMMQIALERNGWAARLRDDGSLTLTRMDAPRPGRAPAALPTLVWQPLRPGGWEWLHWRPPSGALIPIAPAHMISDAVRLVTRTLERRSL